MPKPNKILFGNAFLYPTLLAIALFLFTNPGNGQIRHQQIPPQKFLSLQSPKSDSSGPKVTLASLPANFGISRNISGIVGNEPGCNTTTFYMHLSAAAGQDINLREVQTLPGGNFVLTGNTGIINTGEEGFISIITNAGAIVSQQRIRINNKPVSLWATKVLFNGKMVISGVMNDGSNQIFIALLNEDFSTDWVQLYQMPSAPQKTTLDITNDDEYTFAVQLSSSIVYALIRNDGSINWSWQVYPQGLTELVGFSEINFNYALVTNGIRAGKKAVNFLRFNMDGTVLSDNVVGNGREEYDYKDLKTFGREILNVGVLKNEAGKYSLVRDIHRPENIISTEHSYSLPLPIDFNTSAAFDNAGDVMGFCFPQEGKLVFIRQLTNPHTLPEHSRQYDVPVGASIAGVARSLKDAGFLFGLNTVNSNEIILVKTDSIGIIAGCSYQSILNEFTKTLFKGNTQSGTVYNNFNIPLSAASLTTQAVTFTPVFDCNTNYCPEPPSEDTCLSSYFKTYRTNGHSEAFTDHLLLRNNTQIVGGSKVDRVLNNGHTEQTYWIKKLDEKGAVLKGVHVFCDGINTSFELKKVDDQHFMMVSYAFRNDDSVYYTFTLINDNLDIVWSKAYTGFKGFFYGMDFTIDTEGNTYFTAIQKGYEANPGLLVLKLNASGDYSWLKLYETTGRHFMAVTAATTPTSLVAIIEGDDGTNMTVQLDKGTGMLLNTHSFTMSSSGGQYYPKLFKYDKDRIFYAGNNSEYNFTMAIFDTTGMPLKIKDIKQGESRKLAATTHDGHLYGMYKYFNGSQYKNVLFKTDNDLNIQFMNEYEEIVRNFPAGMNLTDNGAIYVAGNYHFGGLNSYYFTAYIQKYQPDGSLGNCGFQAITPEILEKQMTIGTPKFFPGSKTLQSGNIPVALIPLENSLTIGALLCNSLPACNSVKISGPAIVYSLTDHFTFEAVRNAGCNLDPIWIYDTAFTILKSNSTPLAEFSFKKTGSTWIKVSINTGCGLYLDSMLVQIENERVIFSLGEDKVLCPGDSILLNAGADFISYKWQDGSADPVFKAGMPGKYYVEVSSVTGNIFSDTLLITSAIIPNMNLGNDLSVCVGDTLKLSATSGFASYTWQFSGMIHGQGSSIFLLPVTDGTVSVLGLTGDGCEASDTISIMSIKMRPVFLGNDTSFCAGDFITLSAGEGYTNYVWNTGAANSSLKVNQAGNYWVNATDANGCIARDTIKVQIFSLPVLNLGNDFDICNGQQNTLDAGVYNQYLWNDGSKERYNIASMPGTYSVTVIDNNFCSGTDEVALKNILPLPSGFLKPLDSLCERDRLTISSKVDFKNYLWSTGSQLKSVTIEQTGNYSLTVGDENGCIGKETILIVEKKECIKAVYIPSAFTPNNDGINDLFRATVFGNLSSFKLNIYTQWGEIIFTTTDHKKGWDGTKKGMAANAGVFVWVCSYEPEGGKPAFQKGTVTLIR